MKNSVDAFKITFYPDSQDNVLGVQVVLNEELIEKHGENFEEFSKRLELTAFSKIVNKAVEIYVRELQNIKLEEIEK